MRPPYSIALLPLLVCSVAHAETFTISYENRAAVDPAENFDADCLGATEKADCDVRAAALEAELVEMLGELEGLRDSETQGLFTAAVQTESPAVREVGLRYFSRLRTLPTDLWSNVKTFFLGPDPAVGQASAEVLAFSSAEVDQQLSDLYLDFRSSDRYGNDPPDETGGMDPWAEACAEDALLDEVPAFPEAQRFSPASRLLMIDSFMDGFVGGSTVRMPVSGFVTDASKATVEAHFSALFKKQPHPPAAETQAKLQALNLELTTLTERIQRGDQAAATRLQQVLDEVTKLSDASIAFSVVPIDEQACPDCVLWIDASGEDVYSKGIGRAVAVGTDPLLAKTVIRYIGAMPTSGPQPGGNDGGTPTGHSDGGGNPDPNRPDAGSDDPTTPGKKSDGGCATLGAPDAGLWLLPLALVLRRRKLSRRRARAPSAARGG
jgi:hypothetical protein